MAMGGRALLAMHSRLDTASCNVFLCQGGSKNRHAHGDWKKHTDPQRARAYVQVYTEAQPQITACCTVRRRFRIT